MTADKSSNEVTDLSKASACGNTAAQEKLLALVYDELRALARSYLRHESPSNSLDPTGLVHEAYMKLVDHDRISWQGKSHFFAIGAQAMRRILIDHARGRQRAKRGGGMHRLSFSEDLGIAAASVQDYSLLSETLERLQARDPRQAEIVELRFLGGMKIDEIAEHLGVSKRTVEADWTMAKAWLRRELTEEQA